MFKRFICLAVWAFVLAIASNVSADLIAHWRFDEGSGTIAADTSGNSNDGTLMGNPQWVTGKIGGALEFDGDGDYVDCGNDAIFDITEEITLAIWVNANDILNGSGQPSEMYLRGAAEDGHGLWTFSQDQWLFPLLLAARTNAPTSIGL